MRAGPSRRDFLKGLGASGAGLVAGVVGPTSYLSLCRRFQPFLGTDLPLGANLNSSITGNRAYTRAHFLYYAGVVTPGVYR